MNGDEHYAEAERLVNKSSGGGDWAPDNCSILIAAAQVHATLALAYHAPIVPMPVATSSIDEHRG